MNDEDREQPNIVIPETVEPPPIVEEQEVGEIEEQVEEKPEPEADSDGLSDLFEVPQPEDNDMVTDHLVEVDEEDDLSDLTDVSVEDVMGEAPEPEPPKKRYRIVPRGRRVIRREPPSTTLGGVQY
jgi:hypothetical protein